MLAQPKQGSLWSDGAQLCRSKTVGQGSCCAGFKDQGVPKGLPFRAQNKVTMLLGGGAGITLRSDEQGSGTLL